MKKILFASLWMIGLLSCTHSSSYREDFVRTYFEKYPESTLQDIYKGSFQDIFRNKYVRNLHDRKKDGCKKTILLSIGLQAKSFSFFS